MLARNRSPILRRILIPITAAMSTLLLGVCTAQTPAFEGNGAVGVGLRPDDAAIGDLDGDGHADIVVCGQFMPMLKVYWGGLDGFAPLGIAVPTAALAVVLADVDNDGKLDIVALTGSVTVVRNLGNGTFAAPTSFSLLASSSPKAIAAGDIDGDGDIDIAVAVWAAGTAQGIPSAQLLFNLGNGTFGLAVGLGSPGGRGSHIALGDTDGDGDLDLVVVETEINRIIVQRNLGSSFSALTQYPAGSFCHGVFLADIDGDLDLDIAFFDQLILGILRNQGGAFTPAGTHPMPPGPLAMVLADLDGDGDKDLAASGGLSGDYLVRISLNTGNGSFVTAGTIISGLWSTTIDAVDLDQDGDLDLLAGNQGGSVTLLWNHGNATFASGTQITGCPQAASVALGDLNGNGIPDAVTTGVSTVAVYLDPGTSLAGPPASYALATPSDVVIADMDGDGDLDVVVAQGGANAVSIGWNQGNGVIALSSTFPLAGIPICVRTGDLDGDGDLDVLVANYSGGTVAVLMNLGATQFSAATYYPTAPPQWMELGDLDGDLDLDLAVMNTSNNTVSIFFNAGNGSFGPATIYPMPGAKVEVADLDGDGDLDLATGFAVGQSSGINFSQNIGGGFFAAPVPIPGSVYLFHIFATDLDHDGDQDLIGSNPNPQTVLWMQNHGGMSFELMPSISVPITGMTLGDVDVDGDIDLVTASIPLGGIAIVRDCAASGHVICTGDGSATACPCGNTSAPSAGSGCLNSTGAGATIRAVGPAGLAHDRLALRIDGLPNETLALLLQGSSAASAGAGVVFGDGLLCAGGSLIRLGIEFAPQGSTSFPSTGDARLSTVGSIGAGDERVYQAWYRNSVSFCTASAFNLTNGIVVRWGF